MRLSHSQGMMDGWMTCDLMVFFQSISVISGRLKGDNEKLCAIETPLKLKKISASGISFSIIKEFQLHKAELSGPLDQQASV